MDDETKKGIEYLRGIFESGKVLRLGEPQPLGQFNFWNYFVVRAYAKEWDFAISRDELSDLPGTRAYHKPANELARGLEQRFRNVSPNTFVTATGRLILLDVEWPIEAWAGRAASCLKVRVTDTFTKKFAYCFVSITHQQCIFELKENPFQIHAAIANSIRLAVDNGALTFYPSANEHPVELQQVPLRFRTYISGDTDPSQFLKRKVLALGFKSGGKDTQVWIADPWDADYLGVETRSLQQEAEILEAEGFFVFSEDRVVASCGQKLLLEARPYVRNSQTASQAPQVANSRHKHDVFLSHASEDKPFVRELASELDKRNVTYWLDESEIKLGDSLRRVIDEGLKTSRFGVVILSPHFFAKEWPQRELDGLLASEIDRKVVLPVWHEIGEEEVKSYSPTLAGRFAAKSSAGAPSVANAIVAAIASDKK